MSILETEPSIRLTCTTGERCKVYFEPWGSEHVLERNEVIEVRTTAFMTGDVEISFDEHGIALTFTSSAPITARRSSGEELAI